MSELLTEEQAANLLQMSESWLRQRRYAGDGPPFHTLGVRTIRYDHDEVMAWAKSESQTETVNDKATGISQ